MRCLRWIAFPAAALVAAAGFAAPASAATAPAGNAFYRPPAALVAGPHGSLVWSRPAAPGVGLPSAARTTTVLYRSRSLAGRPIVVSGTVSIPRGAPPRGGWPLITWAHGTTGVADRCAPSRGEALSYLSSSLPSLDHWVAEGYAVARTDYEGLGAPGVHPYLIGRSEGRGVLDAARAARRLDPRIGRTFVVMGHSEGGHAALFAAALAPRWTPELDFRGVTAYAPGSHLLEQVKAAASLPGGSAEFSTLGGLILAGAAAVSPDVRPERIVAPGVLPRFSTVYTRCAGDVGRPDALGGVPPASLVPPGPAIRPLYTVLAAQNPSLHITKPARIVQGTVDRLVLQPFTDRLARELAANGTRLTYLVKPGLGHPEVVGADRADADAWLARSFR